MTPQQRTVRDRFAVGSGAPRRGRARRVARAARPGEWPPTDVVRHLIAVEEEVWQPRLRQLIDEDEPRWPWAEPDRWQGSPGASLDDLLAVHADRRAATVALLDGLGDAGWERSGVHEVYGRLDVAGLMRRAGTTTTSTSRASDVDGPGWSPLDGGLIAARSQSAVDLRVFASLLIGETRSARRVAPPLAPMARGIVPSDAVGCPAAEIDLGAEHRECLAPKQERLAPGVDRAGLPEREGAIGQLDPAAIAGGFDRLR